MNDFREATLEALDEIGHDAAVAQARRRVAARLEARERPGTDRLRRWAPAAATLALAASAAVVYAVIVEPDHPGVLAVPEPEEELEEFPPDDTSRPGFAPRPPIPHVRPVPIPDAPPFAGGGDDEGDEDDGTLVAIAIGGTCQWSVDDQPMGRSSSIRIRTSVGRHVVACDRPGRERREVAVEVKPGKPGIASFRLHEPDLAPPANDDERRRQHELGF